MGRPATIGIKDLSSAVTKAVAAVAAKQKIQLEHQLHIGPIITGIILRPQDLNHAEAVAAELTSQLKSAGGAALGAAALEPAVLIAGGRITCGFIAPEIAIHE